MLTEKVLLLFAAFWKLIDGFQYGNEFNEEYYKMPPLYLGDNFNQCNQIYKDQSTYCMLYSTIKPDESSELYSYIRNFSSQDKLHFKHDRLRRGICLNRCEKLIEELEDSEHLFVEMFDPNLQLDSESFYKASFYQKNYNKLVNKCVNLELLKYNLSAYSSIYYCVGESTEIPFDYVDAICSALFIGIIILVSSSSLYDRYLKKMGNLKNEHYYTELERNYHKILTTFSIKRNWYMLVKETKSDYRELRFLNAGKAVALFMVMIGHSYLALLTIPSKNPEFIENMYHKIETMGLINGAFIVQVFFGISGFLTTVLTLSYIRKTNSTVNYGMVFKTMMVRYLRFAPLLLVFVLFQSTLWYRLTTGPFWNLVSESERFTCRNYWWSNFLFINNYYPTDKVSCLVHTWYLATDFQLGILGAIVFVFVQRNPKLKYWTFAAIFLTSMFICAYVSYYYELGAIYMLKPESFRNLFAMFAPNDKNYLALFYTPAHLNLAVYFTGILIGFHYFGFRKILKDHKKTMTKQVIFWGSGLVVLAIQFSHYIFYNYDIPMRSITTATIATLIKHHFSVYFAIALLGFIFGYGSFLKPIAKHPIFRVLGRITFAAYLVHMGLVRYFIGANHFPIEGNYITLLSYSILVTFFSNFFGLFLTLFVDLPASTLLKLMIFKKRMDNNNEKDDASEMETLNQAPANRNML